MSIDLLINTPRIRWLLLGMALAALAVAATALVDRFAERRAVEIERARLIGVVQLAASGYQRQVDKFQLVAITLSADPDVGNLLDRRTAQDAGRLNRRLADLTAALDASVIYLLDDRGLTIASSNWRQTDSFLGENYGFRTYFTQAMMNGQWEQFALGTRSRIPGLFVARRVQTGSGKRGVIVVKIRFDRLEAEWAKSPGLAFVASPQGVILASSQPAWRFETIGKLGQAERQRLTAQVEYGGAPLRQNALFAGGSVIQSSAAYSRSARYIRAIETLPNGWSVNLLAPIEMAAANARSSARIMLALALAAAAALIAAYVLRARAIVAQQQRESELRLAELKERLEQANKLSTLGQIAAGVGHEINQPLTAIGIRAQTARRLIGKNRFGDAEVALQDIAALTARAGAITGELVRFSRRGDRRLSKVLLTDVFAGVELLLGERIRSKAASLVINGAAERVIGEQGRLEQVFVNLIQNALDAMDQGGEIRIAATRAEAVVTICVRDTGPGVPAAVRDRLFQPFNSSKDAGLGLGLVISRDIMTDLGGELLFIAEGKAACFTLTLRAAP